MTRNWLLPRTRGLVQKRTEIAHHLREIFRALRASADGQHRRTSAPADLGTAETNIAFNRHRWGDIETWREVDRYGYRWGRGIQQNNHGTARIAETWLRPYLNERFDLKILELAPGAGRFTVELVRVSRDLHLVDMNEACIELCKERFKYYPNIHCYLNDGMTCSVVDDVDFDLIACFDSMVHMTPDVIESYVADFKRLLLPGGICWLDHSGKGLRDLGHRTDMTDLKMREIAERHGYIVVEQHFRNEHDCISVLRKPA